jgi:hypothetical protein
MENKASDKVIRQDIRHMGYRLLVKNPKAENRGNPFAGGKEKQKFAKFIGVGIFGSRDLVHDYLRRYYPDRTNDMYRIQGIKINFTPTYYAAPKSKV